VSISLRETTKHLVNMICKLEFAIVDIMTTALMLMMLV